jgi:hypothetical protein
MIFPSGTATPTLVIFLTLAALILFIDPSSFSAARTGVPPAPGVWCSREVGRELSTEQRQLLTRSLQRITGWEGIKFSAYGSLVLDEVTQTSSGSSIARQVLKEVLRSGLVFIIEDYSKSDSVNFGQLDEGTDYDDGERRVLIWRVRVDFDDFRQMQAPAEVRASFDEGFLLLHETLHGLGLKDSMQDGEVGECEAILNQARVELGLPVRDQYLGQTLYITPSIMAARLRFKSRRSSSTKWKWHYLYFFPGRETVRPFPQ